MKTLAHVLFSVELSDSRAEGFACLKRRQPPSDYRQFLFARLVCVTYDLRVLWAALRQQSFKKLSFNPEPQASSFHTSRIRHGGFVRGLNAFLTGVRRISPPKVRVVGSHFVGGRQCLISDPTRSPPQTLVWYYGFRNRRRRTCPKSRESCSRVVQRFARKCQCGWRSRHS